MPDEYSDARYRELNRQLAKRERSTKRKARESLAGRGALHSGMTSATEREIEGGIGEEFTRGARDIEDRRWRAEQDEIARKWQTGERVGGEQHQTGMQTALFGQQTSERIGTQEWASGESEAERNVRMELQKMADDERYRLQQLVQSGAMELQDAEQEWQAFENGLNRTLEWQSTSGQWGHEAGMQETGIVQEQWAAEFGAESAMALQDDTQSFEHFMARIGRDWELADRPWQEQMFLMDAQLQMLVAGYDWLTDEYGGGTPSWMVEDPEKPGTPPSEGTGYTTHPYAAEAPEDLPPSMQAAYDTLTPEQQAQFWATAPQWREWYLNFYGRA